MAARLAALGWQIAQGGLLLLLVWLPFSIAAVEITFGIMLGGWLLGMASPEGRARSLWGGREAKPLRNALLLFLAACAASALGSTHPGASLEGLVEKWLEYLLLFVIAADLARDARVFRRCALLLAVGAALVASEGISQELWGKGWLKGHKLYVYERMTGPYRSPSDLATYLMVVIPIVLSQAIAAARRAARWALVVLLVVLLACFGRTESTGPWAGLLLGMGLAAWLTPHRPFRRWCLWLAAVAVVCVVAALAWSGHFYAFSLSDLGTVDRVHMWGAALRMIGDRPVFGHGLNTFMANYLMYWVGGEAQPRYAHNCYLQMAAETGLAGLGAFLWLLWQVVRRMAQRLRAAQPEVLLTGWCAGVWAFLLHAAVDTNFYSLRAAALFWVLAGLAIGSTMRLPQRHHPA